MGVTSFNLVTLAFYRSCSSISNSFLVEETAIRGCHIASLFSRFARFFSPDTSALGFQIS
jgi:hypothetical protein